MSGINIFTLEMFAGETNNPWRGQTNRDYLLKCLGSICYCMQIQGLTSIIDSSEQREVIYGVEDIRGRGILPAGTAHMLRIHSK